MNRLLLSFGALALASSLVVARATSQAVPLQVGPNSVPTGTILPFGGASVPAGFMLCDGTELSRAQHPRLFAAIGESWGATTGFTFSLPDLRGRFLRGVDGGAGNDPDRFARFAIQPGGNTGDNVGSGQRDGRLGFPASSFGGLTSTNGDHSHPISTNQDDFDGCCTGVSFMRDGGSLGVWKTTNSAGSHNHSVSVNVGFSGDNETRPKNANVNYIIKF